MGARTLIAIQGPRSVEMLAAARRRRHCRLRYYFCAEGRVNGVPAVIARTGYTGEDGFELFVDGPDAAGFGTRCSRHRTEGLEPCGLGARDVLRLEAGMPLYGHELTETITPVQAGLNWALKLDKPEFVGKKALEEQLDGGSYSRIVGLVMEGRAPARESYPVSFQGRSSERYEADRSLRRSRIRTSRRRSWNPRPHRWGRDSKSRSAERATARRSSRCRSTNAQNNREEKKWRSRRICFSARNTNG